MRAVVQRVSRAEVRVDGQRTGGVGRGFLVLLGVTHGDGRAEADWLARKIAGLRLFEDAEGKMNLAWPTSVAPPGVSQFTLYGDARRGRRPASPKRPVPSRPAARGALRGTTARAGLPVETGRFGALMEVELVNDGPVTLWIDTADGSRDRHRSRSSLLSHHL